MLKKSYKYSLLFVICSLSLVLVAAGFLSVSQWLQAGDAPGKAAAIIVLAGCPARAVYSADLYKQGAAPEVYVSRPVREHGLKMLEEFDIYIPRAEEIYKQILLKKGVPESHVHVFGTASVSTFEEAEVIKVLSAARTAISL